MKTRSVHGYRESTCGVCPHSHTNVLVSRCIETRNTCANNAHCLTQVWGSHPSRLRLLDLPFTAVEWVQPDPWEYHQQLSQQSTQKSSTPARASSAAPDTPSSAASLPKEGGGSVPVAISRIEDLPEERLAFTLGDGRMGVLVVKGRKVQQDTAAVRPVLPGPEEMVSHIPIHRSCFHISSKPWYRPCE